MREIIIGKNEKDQRIDRYLTKYLNNTSKTNIFKLLRKKRIKVNGKKVEEKYFILEGDIVQIHLHENAIEEMIKPLVKISAEKVNLDIVYEDEEILIINKPKGLLTHPDQSEYKNTLSTKVQIYLRELCTRTFKPASIQRLDKNTSGLVIFGKTYDSLKKYNEYMRNREIKKFYLTVVSGKPKETGEIKGYMQKDESRNKITVSEKEKKDSKFMHTKYRVLKSNGKYSLLEVELLTGRTHQIRGSMSYINHPIVGDIKYGGDKIRNTQLLHAYKVEVDGNTFENISEEIEEFVDRYIK